MLSASILLYLSQRGVRNLAHWARLAGVDPSVVHQARHHGGRIAEAHARALGRVIGVDVDTVRAIIRSDASGLGLMPSSPSLVTKASAP